MAGTATLATGAGTLTVTQTSSRAIINWQDFSLAAGDYARFIQPDATSATLNRVISGRPSSLDGTLLANGRVYLINPNGILIGTGARLDTAGFLASTLDVTNQEFLAGGDLHFTGGSTAAVKNLGAINALGGDVFLIARAVENAGTVTADHGTAGVAAGSEVLLTTGGNERLFVLAASGPGTVVNSGTINAATAELKAAGGNAYALAINNSGLVRATGTARRNGQLWLVASGESTVINSGTLAASSPADKGGQVVVTGGHVVLDPSSRIDASGTSGGGAILVFGGRQGDGLVMVHGTLDTSAASGAGGFIETSASRVHVAEEARVTTAAPDGHSGTWLIDPVDFTIAATGGDMTGTAVGTALAGGNFTIQSTTGGAGTAGDVNVNDPISWNANKLTLIAQNNVIFNSPLNGSGTASLALEYGQNAVTAGNPGRYVVKAAINLPAGSNFSTKLGSDGPVRPFVVITGLGAPGSTTAADLQGMAGNLAGLYVLGADIAATVTAGWNAGAGFAPIGDATTKFTGLFDGLGHTIDGLAIARPAQANTGLFGYVGPAGELRNAGLTGGSVVGALGTGSLAGSNDGTIASSYATGTVSGSKNVGGLVGANLGTIRDVWATGNVSNASGGIGFVGGLVGNTGSSGSITNAWAAGNVSGLGPNVGGLVGFASNGIITNTYATGTVSGTNFVGGLVGSGAGPVNNSYATGGVSGTGSYIGGLVGYIYPGITISNTYATGTVSGVASVGGLVGNNAGSISASYWNSTINATGIGGGTVAGATGRTSAEMMQLASFAGFTIAGTSGSGAVWRIYEGNTTPWLTVFLRPLSVTANSATTTYSGTAYSGGNGVTYAGAGPNPVPSGLLVYSGTAQAAVNAGSYVISTSGLYSPQQGYDISHVNGTLTINPANLILGGTQIYDRTTIFAGTGLTATGVNGETFTVTGAGAPGNLTTKDVQTGQPLASVAGLAVGTGNTGAAVSTNYNGLATASSAVSVTPKVLTIAGFASDDKIYNGTAVAVIATAGTLSGVVTGDTVGFSQTGATFATKDVGVGKTVTLNGVILTGSGDQANYRHTATTTDLSNITAATLTYTATPASRLFGASDPAFSGTVGGFVGGEAQGTATIGTLVFNTTATVASVAGLYPINGSGLTANNGNYLFVQASPNATAFTISGLTPPPAPPPSTPLTITADNKTKAYGATLPVFTASFAGFLNGDTAATVTGLQFRTTATMGSNVGTFAITPFGATAANYSLAYVPGILTIAPAALTLTAANAGREFGLPNPVFTGSYTGFVNGDTAAVVSGSVFNSPATPASAAGDYPITPSGAVAANYLVTFVNGILRVTTPSVIVGSTPLPVFMVDRIPALTTAFAVVRLGDRLILVPVGSTGGPAASVDARLSLTLGEATSRAVMESAPSLPRGGIPASAADFGRFELATSSGGGAAPANEPGLFRESKVNMGGFNIIYHEALAAARAQSDHHTALGSSYREFSDEDHPQVNIVRAKQDRKPAESAAGRDSPGAP